MEPLPQLDLLAVGEALVDLIAEEPRTPLALASTYQRVLGGSVANVAVAFAHLGGRAALAAAVGRGPFGDFVIAELGRHGVDSSGVVRRSAAHTSLVVISRGMATPEFEVRRGADHLLAPADLPADALATARVVHGSVFALSRRPARDAVLLALESARARGAMTSLDLNYHDVVWEGLAGQPTVARAVAAADHVKASRDDLERLFGPGVELVEAAGRIHAWGARTLVVTLGAGGAWFSADGRSGRIEAVAADVVDTTGAGDAFWAGVLRGLLLRQPILDAIRLGTAVAAHKVRGIGPLEDDLDATALLGALVAT